jgi:hypothetical protein
MTPAANDPWAFRVDTTQPLVVQPYDNSSNPHRTSTSDDLPQRDDPRERREKVRSGPFGVQLPWFLPYFDDQQTISENAAMRLAYRKMLNDPNVKAALYGKIGAVQGLDLKIIPSNRKDKHAQELAELVQWNLTQAVKDGWPGIVWTILVHGLIDGYSISEKVWSRREGGKFSGAYFMRALKPKDTGHDVVPVTDEFRNVTAIRTLRYNPGLDFHPSNFIIYRHLPLFDTATGQSDFRGAYSTYWMLDVARKLRAMGIEKRAMPVIIGHYQNAQDRPAVEDALSLIKTQNWIALPEQVRTEVLNLAGAGDSILTSAMRDLAEDIFLAIAGATLQARQGDVNNARGSSAEHRNTADLFIRYLAQRLESLLNDEEEGFIKELCDLNAPGVQEYPKAALQAVDEKDHQARIKTYYTGWEMGMNFSRQAMNDEFGFQPPDVDDPDDTLGSKADQEAQVAAATLAAPKGHVGDVGGPADPEQEVPPGPPDQPPPSGPGGAQEMAEDYVPQEGDRVTIHHPGGTYHGRSGTVAGSASQGTLASWHYVDVDRDPKMSGHQNTLGMRVPVRTDRLRRMAEDDQTGKAPSASSQRQPEPEQTASPAPIQRPTQSPKYAMRTPSYDPHGDPKTSAWAAQPPTRADYEQDVEEITRSLAERYRESAYDHMLHQGEVPDLDEDDHDGLEEVSNSVDALAREWAEGDVRDRHYDEHVFGHLPVHYLNRDPDFTHLYQSLKEDPTDTDSQAAMNDWLEEHGLDRFKFYFDDDEDHPRARPFGEFLHPKEDLRQAPIHTGSGVDRRGQRYETALGKRTSVPPWAKPAPSESRFPPVRSDTPFELMLEEDEFAEGNPPETVSTLQPRPQTPPLRGSLPLIHPELLALTRAASSHSQKNLRDRHVAQHALADWYEDHGQGHLLEDRHNHPSQATPRHLMAANHAHTQSAWERERLMHEVLGLHPDTLHDHLADAFENGRPLHATLDPEQPEEHRLGEYLQTHYPDLGVEWREGGHPRNWRFGRYPEGDDYFQNYYPTFPPSLRRGTGTKGDPVEEFGEEATVSILTARPKRFTYEG